MTLSYLLLALRIISALLLLSFLFGLAWIAYQDMRYTARLAESQNTAAGYLRVISSTNNDDLENVIFPLQAITRIGRAAGNTIVLEDDYISNEHIKIERREGQWWLTDLGSRNGTLLNDQALNQPTIISMGDIITIGGTALAYEQMVISQDAEIPAA